MTRSLADEYVLHGMPRSLFTRKLQVALDFYRLPYRVAHRGIGGGDALAERAGTHQVPILQTPENWVLADTTPILELLDARVPGRRMFPPGPTGVLVRVVEEILDEWVARVMVHYRWHYLANTLEVIQELTGRKVTEEEASQHPMAQWGPRACRATGTEGTAQRQAAEDEYLRLMKALDHQLGETRFAMGDRPTAVDCILLGGLHAHTNADPIPDLSGYPRVLSWAEGGAVEAAMANTTFGDLPAFPDCTNLAREVLKTGREQYVPFVWANAHALESGAKAFEIETYGEPTSYLARDYPERSRRQLQNRVRTGLLESERSVVVEWLEDVGLECFLP